MSATPVKQSAPNVMGRSLILFCNFLLVILAYYQVKAASRSLLIEFGGADAFPYVWIGSAAVLLAFISVYNAIVARFSRVRLVVGSLVGFALLLCLFRWRLVDGGIKTVVAFYIFVDLFSVVLVEQFWSLTNSITRLDDGKRSYWFVGTGGLVGGVAGGILASALLEHTSMQTEDLLLSCGAMLVLTGMLNLGMARHGLYAEIPREECIELEGDGLKAVLRNRYLVLIAAVLCFSQLAQPIVEFQFLSAVSVEYIEKNARTQFISQFFSIMGLVSIAINVVLTPLIHRYLGIIAGLTMQPVLLSAASIGFVLQQGLASASVMKICDRGLSYSINRASKELLYIPVDPVLTFQAKAWIDMLGYRLFKVLGSSLILLVTAHAPALEVARDLVWLTLLICVAWVLAIYLLGQEQRRALAPVLGRTA